MTSLNQTIQLRVVESCLKWQEQRSVQFHWQNQQRGWPSRRSHLLQRRQRGLHHRWQSVNADKIEGRGGWSRLGEVNSGNLVINVLSNSSLGVRSISAGAPPHPPPTETARMSWTASAEPHSSGSRCSEVDSNGCWDSGGDAPISKKNCKI
ncbi:hypothetical protein Ocin01_16643 [Orchesella cincta]|uniref:Uncharacterized protein n=1 Tax=Orchesella cincta TaxID=48709 RepID=A0A1D2MAT1_ORCCI|nr:hypothetical protein Ocin01_16643 [Orchesella cincta]